jgi:hypothetical protein
MRFTYRLIKDARGYLAECIEAEAAGEGKSARDALESLREALKERMFRADAIAPPPGSVESEIELALTEDGQSEPSASV